MSTQPNLLLPILSTEELNQIDNLSERLGKLGFTEKATEDFKSYVYERQLWSNISDAPTPPEIVKMRDGAYDVDTGSNIQLEYFPEDYTLSELNRLFPGWWTEKMLRSNWEEVVKLETILVEGYLMIPYITPSGTKVRRIWAIAGSDIKFRKGTKTPVDIANGFKGGRTEWLRVAGKWLGIGLDIYHQRITVGLRRIFEDRIRVWSHYAEHWKGVAAACETGKTFRTMLKTMPSEIQIRRVVEVIKYIPESKHEEVWGSLGKLSNANDDRKKQFEKWLITLEGIAEKNKVKKEGEENGNSKI